MFKAALRLTSPPHASRLIPSTPVLPSGSLFPSGRLFAPHAPDSLLADPLRYRLSDDFPRSLPGQDVFGVERHAVNLGDLSGAEFGADQSDAVGQQKLHGGIGHPAQHSSQMTWSRQAGKGIETQPRFGR